LQAFDCRHFLVSHLRGFILLKVKAIGCQLSAIGQKTPVTVPDLWPKADSQLPTAKAVVTACFADLMISRFHFEILQFNQFVRFVGFVVLSEKQ
jgi:hypothetical protein